MSSTYGPHGQDVPPSAFGAAGTGDVLAASDETPARRAPWLLAAGAGLLVLGLVAGVTYGVGALSGGGSQPESALPSGAFAYVKVDLDPSAGQKVDGFRFLRKFPALRDHLDGDDLRKIAFEAVSDAAGWDGVDFDTDVAPWMGERVALAAYPPRGAAAGAGTTPEPVAVVALQVRDEGAARDGLAALTRAAARGEADQGPLGYVVSGDYALLAPTQQQADRAAADAADATLDQDGDFSRDLADAGDGVLTAWVDAAGAAESMGGPAGGVAGLGGLGLLGGPAGMVGGVSGRSTYVARFDGPDVFEVTGQVRDADTAGWATAPVDGVAELPASSVVALGVADGDELVNRAYESLRDSLADRPGGGPSLDEMVADAERQLGIEIPDDIAALLGDNLVAALDGGRSGRVEAGARVRTDVVRAERVLDAISRAAGGSLPLVRERAGEDLVVASTRRQAQRLAAAGTLGEQPAFADALPDLDEAHAALWVDLAGVMAALFGGPGSAPGAGEPDPDLEPVEGVGVTLTSGDEGTATFRLRLVTS